MSSRSTSINLELLEELLEFEPRRTDGSAVDLADPPRDDDGELICGRRRVDRLACTSPVRIPWMPCDTHEPDDPIV